MFSRCFLVVLLLGCPLAVIVADESKPPKPASELPSKRADPYTKDELLALGYNAGGGNMRIFARGRKAGSQAQSYLDRLHGNWAKSAEALKS